MSQGTEHQSTSQTKEFIMHVDCNEGKKGYQAFCSKVHCGRESLLTIPLLMAVIGLVVVVGVRGLERHSASEVLGIYASCPDGWIGYLGKCYYFSEDEVDWFSSLKNCSSLGASLSSIETEQEMDFLLRYKGPVYHWIGLRRNQGMPWEWANGKTFNHTLFDIVEVGDCAYLNDVEVMSSWCKTKKNWICSKPDAYLQLRKQVEEQEQKQGSINASFK